MRITAEITSQNKPLWALQALAHFPFDRDIDYPDDRLSEIQSAIVSYLKGVTYKRRNTITKLVGTHFINDMKRVITVTNWHNTVCLIVVLSKQVPIPGTCAVCGCTEDHACYNPYYGSCWWIGRSRILCSHCAIIDIADSSDTVHPKWSSEI